MSLATADTARRAGGAVAMAAAAARTKNIQLVLRRDDDFDVLEVAEKDLHHAADPMFWATSGFHDVVKSFHLHLGDAKRKVLVVENIHSKDELQEAVLAVKDGSPPTLKIAYLSMKDLQSKLKDGSWKWHNEGNCEMHCGGGEVEDELVGSVVEAVGEFEDNVTVTIVNNVDVIHASHDHEPPIGWVMEESEEYPGHYFYVNVVTDEVTWDRPREDAKPGPQLAEESEEEVTFDGPVPAPLKTKLHPSHHGAVKHDTSKLHVDEANPRRQDQGASGTKAGHEGSGHAQGYYREEIEKIYREHDPSKLHGIPKLLLRFKGSEDEMLRMVCEKYDIPFDGADNDADAESVAVSASEQSQHDHEPPAGWVMEESEDYPGHYFYVNVVTDEVTWDRPPEDTHTGETVPAKAAPTQDHSVNRTLTAAPEPPRTATSSSGGTAEGSAQRHHHAGHLHVAAVVQPEEASQQSQHDHEPPAGWVMEESEDYPGHYFYVNVVTDEVTWDRPPEDTHTGEKVPEKAAPTQDHSVNRTLAATLVQSEEEETIEVGSIVSMFPSEAERSVTVNPLRQGAPAVIEATLEPNMARASLVVGSAHIYRGKGGHGGRIGGTRGRGRGRGRGARGRG